MRSLQSLPWALTLCAALCGGCAHGAQTSGHAPITKLSHEQLLEVAQVLLQAGETVRAQQYLLAALKEGAPESLVMPSLLRLYVADGQYRLAIEQAENYTRRHPRDVGVRLFLASLYQAVDAASEAVLAYRAVLAVRPDEAQAHFALASILRRQGTERDRADHHYRAYLQVEPHGPHADEARSQLLTELP